MFCQVGALASSKSAMNPSAPELRALIVSLRSVGPVISTQRCWRSSGAGATRQSPSRTSRVSVEEVEPLARPQPGPPLLAGA